MGDKFVTPTNVDPPFISSFNFSFDDNGRLILPKLMFTFHLRYFFRIFHWCINFTPTFRFLNKDKYSGAQLHMWPRFISYFIHSLTLIIPKRKFIAKESFKQVAILTTSCKPFVITLHYLIILNASVPRSFLFLCIIVLQSFSNPNIILITLITNAFQFRIY